MAAARKPKPVDADIVARFDRCACDVTRHACRALHRHAGRYCCDSCTHPPEGTR